MGLDCREPLYIQSTKRKGSVSRLPARVEWTDATTPSTTIVSASVSTYRTNAELEETADTVWRQVDTKSVITDQLVDRTLLHDSNLEDFNILSFDYPVILLS